MPATELRVHLGAALRALVREDLVIEKGGVPVAVLTGYRPEEAAAVEGEYERALSKRAEPRGSERMSAAMAAGWSGIEPEELVANVYRWREKGAPSRRLSLDAVPEEQPRAGKVPARQRRVHPGRPKGKRVADAPRQRYTT